MIWAGSLLEAAEAVWVQVFAVFLRVGALIALTPGFGEQSIPVRVKLGLAIGFTLLVTPAIPMPNVSAPYFPVFIRFLVTETVAGLTLGAGLRMFVFTLQTAGAIAAQATSLAQLLGGSSAEPMPAISHVLVMGGLALAMMWGLHVRVAAYIIESYTILPAGEFPSAQNLAKWGVMQVGASFSSALTLALPFVAMSILYNLTLGVINKAMPQLMVAFVGAPVITFGGLFLLFLLVPLMLSVWHDGLQRFVDAPFGTIR